MISAIIESGLLMASEPSQPFKVLVILISTVLFIAVSAVTAVVTYKMKMKKFRDQNQCEHDDFKEQ